MATVTYLAGFFLARRFPPQEGMPMFINATALPLREVFPSTNGHALSTGTAAQGPGPGNSPDGHPGIVRSGNQRYYCEGRSRIETLKDSSDFRLIKPSLPIHLSPP